MKDCSTEAASWASGGGFWLVGDILTMVSNENASVDELITFGQMALEQGWCDQAREYFEQALVLDASNQEAMKGLARVNERLSRREAAAVEPIPGEPVEPPPSVVRKRKRPWWFWALVVVLGLFGCSIATCLGILIFVVPSPKATPTPMPLKAIPKRTEPYSTATAEPSPTATAEATMGEFVVYEDVKTTVIEYEITGPYLNSYSTEEKPKEGAKFLWLLVRSENVGEVAHDLPSPSQFVLLYKGTKITPRWARHGRQGYTIYDRGENVYPGIGHDGWILYEIPVGADPAEIMVRFTTDKEYRTWRLEAK